MRKVHVFKQFDDGFFLVMVRSFLTTQERRLGDKTVNVFKLIDITRVKAILFEKDLVLANVELLKKFRERYPRYFELNNVYVQSKYNNSYATIDENGQEYQMSDRFDYPREIHILKRDYGDRFEWSPRGYTGEVLLLCFGKGKEGRFNELRYVSSGKAVS